MKKKGEKLSFFDLVGVVAFHFIWAGQKRLSFFVCLFVISLNATNRNSCAFRCLISTLPQPSRCNSVYGNHLPALLSCFCLLLLLLAFKQVGLVVLAGYGSHGLVVKVSWSVLGAEMSTSQQPKQGKTDKGLDAPKNIVVAVKSSKEIPKTALVWALKHVVQPGDCITLIVVVSPHNSGAFFFRFVLLCCCFLSLSTLECIMIEGSCPCVM